MVVESFSPGTLTRWELDAAALRDGHPELVVLSPSLTQTGPHAGLAGFGNVGASLSGFQHLVGWPDRMPLGPLGPYTDYLGPRLALVALLAALERRAQGGTGCYLDVSQVEAGVFFLSPQLAAFAAEGAPAERCGNDDAEHAPHGVYRCLEQDGRQRYVAIAVTDDRQWHGLTTALCRDDLAGDARYATAPGRHQHRRDLDTELAAWTAERTAGEVERLLQSHEVPAHLALDSLDYELDPQLLHRGHLRRVPHPLHGEAVVEGPRYLLSQTPCVVSAAAPGLGEHTGQVLRDLLGYPPERVRALHETGALT